MGDWIVGTGSIKASHLGDIRYSIVYAMRVTAKMTMQEYDSFTAQNLPQKRPDTKNVDYRRKVGDSIYDFSDDSALPRLRKPCVHLDVNRERDLSGRFALLSTVFLYFGDNPQPLPDNLKPIVNLDGEGKPKVGHRSRSNSSYVKEFEKWFYGLGYKPGSLLGKPQTDPFKSEEIRIKCAHECANEDDSESEERE